jgi:hypothetical protein
MAEKKKTSTVKKAVEKVVDTVKEIGNQPMQEQALMQGQVPQETPAAEQRQQEKNVGIDIVNKDGINVESVGDEIRITFPTRKEINYAMSDSATGMKSIGHGWERAQADNKLFEKESLQVKTVGFKKDDLTPQNIRNLAAAIETARTINREYIAERNAAHDYFKELAGNKELVVLGVPTEGTDKLENGEPTGKKEYRPSYFNGDVVKVGKHLIAAVNGTSEKAMYVRLLETSRLPLDAHDYAEKEKAAKSHLGIKDTDIVKVSVNGKDQEIIKNVKRHIAYGADWKISKIADYVPKEQTQSKTKPKKNVKTMAV